jgi:cysteinyl-tRNA synthetase
MQIFNTKVGWKEEFIPQQPGFVRAYVCGPTVYDYCHIGHARTYVNFDVLKRYMMASGLEFLHVQNFTDVDDKITSRAAEAGWRRCAGGQVHREYFRDMDALNVKRATVYAKASDYIPKIVSITEDLLKKEAA